MIATIRKIISYMIYYSGLTCLACRIGSKKTIILVYHRTLNLNHDFNLDRSVVSTSVYNFNKQMGYLSKRYKVISLEKFLEYHKKKKNPPKNSVVITFDDGYRDNYSFAYPILKKYKFPATIFLTTGMIDQKELFWWDKVSYMINKTKIKNLELKGIGRYDLENKKSESLRSIKSILKKVSEAKKNLLMNNLKSILKVEYPEDKVKNKTLVSWDEIKEMGRNNISFGAHTVTHPILTKMPIKEAEEEIKDSKKRIEKKINKKVTSFCYPNGLDSDFDDDIKELLRKYEFECALTYIPDWSTVRSDLFKLRRMFIQYQEDIVEFKNKMIGMDIFLRKIYCILNKKMSRG